MRLKGGKNKQEQIRTVCRPKNEKAEKLASERAEELTKELMKELMKELTEKQSGEPIFYVVKHISV